MKKIIAIILGILMLWSIIPMAFAADKAETELKFNDDGKFKIMLFADLHNNSNAEEWQNIFMCEALDKCQPDLVIYLGDNTVGLGYENQYKAIEKITSPVRERNIPYAIVFGNHDQEFGVSKEDLLKIYQSFDCLTYSADPSIYGCGSCNLPIMSSDGSKVAFNLWLIDSGRENPDRVVGGYDYVHEDQIEWYKKTAAELAEQNGGKVVPAMDFQHIVIPEIFDKLYVKLPFDLGSASQTKFGETYSLIPVFTRLNGYWLEQCCPPNVYDGQLDAWVETGDVIAEFHGHDHNNSFNVNIKGVDIINVPGVGGVSYTKEVSRGAGLITLNEKNPEKYKYELVHFYDIALDKDSQICNTETAKSRTHYFFVKVLDTMVTSIFKILHFLRIDRI